MTHEGYSDYGEDPASTLTAMQATLHPGQFSPAEEIKGAVFFMNLGQIQRGGRDRRRGSTAMWRDIYNYNDLDSAGAVRDYQDGAIGSYTTAELVNLFSGVKIQCQISAA
ncbi:MAG: hypothetical protein MZV63_03090 [Marinilabiliales bacterium]|nr:hypothetical protein [Marinilabiliales bacterium]